MSVGWSKWLVEGNYFSYYDQVVKKYFFVKRRDFAHYEWEWGFPEVPAEARVVSSMTPSGPYICPHVKPTKPSQVYQFIWGQKPDVWIYVELPTQTKRHGLPLRRWPNKMLREVAHFTQQMSPYDRPSFITEHFLVPKLCDLAEYTCFNPLDIDVIPYMNFYVNKINAEHIGDEYVKDETLVLEPAKSYYTEILDRLHRKLVYHRPITLMGVVAPAAEVS